MRGNLVARSVSDFYSKDREGNILPMNYETNLEMLNQNCYIGNNFNMRTANGLAPIGGTALAVQKIGMIMVVLIYLKYYLNIILYVQQRSVNSVAQNGVEGILQR